MHRKFFFIALLLPIVFLLSGCGDSNSPKPSVLAANMQRAIAKQPGAQTEIKVEISGTRKGDSALLLTNPLSLNFNGSVGKGGLSGTAQMNILGKQIEGDLIMNSESGTYVRVGNTWYADPKGTPKSLIASLSAASPLLMSLPGNAGSVLTGEVSDDGDNWTFEGSLSGPAIAKLYQEDDRFVPQTTYATAKKIEIKLSVNKKTYLPSQMTMNYEGPGASLGEQGGALSLLGGAQEVSLNIDAQFSSWGTKAGGSPPVGGSTKPTSDIFNLFLNK